RSPALPLDLWTCGRVDFFLPTLHIVIPFYNERGTLAQCVERVLAAPLPPGWMSRLILVDDGSAPAGREAGETVVRNLQSRRVNLRFIQHPVNKGKGAAVHTGFDAAISDAQDQSDVAIIQDADLEYDPSDYAALLEPIISGRADAVIGTRWGAHRELQGFT